MQLNENAKDESEKENATMTMLLQDDSTQPGDVKQTTRIKMTGDADYRCEYRSRPGRVTYIRIYLCYFCFR